MAPRSKSQAFTQRPFANLGQILSDKAISPRALSERALSEWVKKAQRAPEPLPAEEEARLFQTAMAGVSPLGANRHAHEGASPQTDNPEQGRMRRTITDDEAEGLRQLRELVEEGKGFTLAYTAEYMAGPDGRYADHLSEALHQGRFAIQDHIDLHGMGASEAEAALELFFKRSVAGGKQGLLIVHGRGLRSPKAPVLKNRVKRWLTRGPWRRWVAAFASAQAFDGGTGATYVLLRRTPGKKRRRR